MAKIKKRDKSRETFWRNAMHRQRRSGLSIRAFCRRKKLRESSFYWWRREIARRDAAQRPAGKARRGGPKSLFVPVQVASAVASSRPAGQIEIELPRGTRIHLTAPVDRRALADVVAVLELQEGRAC